MFVSYIGAVVRQNVPITIDNWRDKALKDAKDIIWNDIQVNILIYSFVIYNVFSVKYITYDCFHCRPLLFLMRNESHMF